ncbi:hypothetical protein [Flavobacterium silvaticum]|uniref:Transporter n=1 Tax=Flavobacterium silvaticum TaxID=1852020 RepID=A0A972JFK4_9FLAO|nr:hypothetical protein [Flavobacterium silvaticum]NMH28064.1 hypothetical protein [Flavobacterium silvaticum]
MKAFLSLILFSCGVCYSQVTKSTVNTQETTNTNTTTGVKTSTTTETTDTILPSAQQDIKTTNVTETTTVNQRDAQGVIIQSTVTKTTSVINQTDETIPPVLVESNTANFLNAHIQVVKAETSDNLFKITYFDKSNHDRLTYYETPIVRNGYIGYHEHISVFKFQFPISIVTVPFKVRPNFQGRKQLAKADVDNIGVNLAIYQYSLHRLFYDGKTSNHKFSIGLMAAPMVQEFNEENTNEYLNEDESYTQLMLSSGITLSYTYKELSFTIIPLGWDTALTTVGKHWVYNGRPWYGFGIALDTKFLGFGSSI